MTNRSLPGWGKSNKGELWIRFYHDVARVTFHLFTLLDGAEAVYAKDLPIYQNIAPEVRRWSVRSMSGPSYLDLYPQVMGPDILDMLRREGTVEQLAYKGWVVEVYRLWEDRYRGQFEEAFAADVSSEVIPPELTAMGDFRHIRNDLVHGNGNASEDKTGKCELLNWFRVGERIVLNASHVLDFLHHLGCLGFSPFYTGSELSNWRFGPEGDLLSRQPVPRIVSVRTDLEVHPDSREIWFLISLVYSNGFFSNHASSTGLSDNAENRRQLNEWLSCVNITPEGNLDGPQPWLKVKAEDIYARAVAAHTKHQKGEGNPEFPQGGFPGPWIRFRSG